MTYFCLFYFSCFLFWYRLMSEHYSLAGGVPRALRHGLGLKFNSRWPPRKTCNWLSNNQLSSPLRPTGVGHWSAGRFPGRQPRLLIHCAKCKLWRQWSCKPQCPCTRFTSRLVRSSATNLLLSDVKQISGKIGESAGRCAFCAGMGACFLVPQQPGQVCRAISDGL